MADDTRGVLYPAGLPDFHRIAPPEPVADWVRWFWIPEWDIRPGRVSRQEIIAYPACNLVVEPDLVGIAGPTTRRGHRDLVGRGWAVGALLRPAAVPHLVPQPAAIVDQYLAVRLPELHESVRAAMTSPGSGADHRSAAVAAFARWLIATLPPPAPEGLLANRMAELIDADPEIERVSDLAARLSVSVRTLQRIARRRIGLTPAAMIRRSRLQRAAEALRENPDLDIAEIAASLGYSDHAHLSNDFQAVLGFTPSSYRGSAR